MHFCSVARIHLKKTRTVCSFVLTTRISTLQRDTLPLFNFELIGAADDKTTGFLGRVEPREFQTSKFKNSCVSFSTYFDLVVKKISVSITSRPRESKQLLSEFSLFQVPTVYPKQPCQELNISDLEFSWRWNVEALKLDDAFNSLIQVDTYA